MTPDHGIWNERFRPDSLDNFVGNAELKEKIAQYITSNDLPHLLLSGPPGVGKTTIAKILYTAIDCDHMYINASDERDIETVRTKIQNYAAAAGFKDLKIIVLDEFDGMLPTSQRALRNIMETYSGDTRFILTCNHVERIIEPIISRVQHFELYPPSKNEVAKQILYILKKENIKFEIEDIKTLVSAYYPDIRKTINEAQLHTLNGTFALAKEDVSQSDYKFAILEILQNKKSTNLKRLQEIRQIFADSNIRDYTLLYKFLYDNVLDISEDHISQVILHIAEAQYKDTAVPDKEINATACICNILNTIY